MTAAQFIAECHARTIDPRIAKENPDLVLALLHDNAAEVIRILDEEF